MAASRRRCDEDRSWAEQAACRGMGPDLFFAPTISDDLDNRARFEARSSVIYEQGKRVCRRCPVQWECLEEAFRYPLELFGLWGGHSPKERRRIRARRHQQEERKTA